jgi:uncharacterized membrane protein YkgB
MRVGTLFLFFYVLLLLIAFLEQRKHHRLQRVLPLVSNSPLIWWHFKLFGPYIGSDLIGPTEWLTAVLIITGYLKPKASILGDLIATVMFFTTSTMLVTTPGAIISAPGIHGMRYMSNLGLFLFKDVISFGVALYLISYFGKKAIPFRKQTLIATSFNPLEYKRDEQ